MFRRTLLLAGFTATLFATAILGRPGFAQRRSTDTTPTPQAEAPLRQVIYSVADLVVLAPTLPNLELEPLPCKTNTSGSPVLEARYIPWCRGLTPAGKTLENELVQLVTTTVAPDSWSTAGGQGTINYYPLGMALVVNQTLAAQEEIFALLEALRRMQDVQVAL